MPPQDLDEELTILPGEGLQNDSPVRVAPIVTDPLVDHLRFILLHPRRYLDRQDIRRAPVRLALRRLIYEFSTRALAKSATRDRVIRIDDESRFMVRWSDTVERSIYLSGYFELATALAFRRIAKRGMSVIDVGAHVGQFTIIASKRVGRDGVVVSVEPNPRNRERLERNLRLNNCANVKVIPKAIARTRGVADFYLPSGPSSSALGSLRPGGLWEDPGFPDVSRHEQFQVLCDPLDAVVSESGLVRVDLVKIDVEGMELAVLLSAETVVKKLRPIIIFEVPFTPGVGMDYGALAFLEANDYRLYSIGLSEQGGTVLRAFRRDLSLSAMRDYYSLNLVAVHKAREGPDGPTASVFS